MKIRYTTGVAKPSATWGSSTFGGPISWGQQASDPVTGLNYFAMPWPDGQPSGWRYRVGDTQPDVEVVVASQTTGPIDSSPVAAATLLLDRFNSALPHHIVLYLTPEADRFRRVLVGRDLDAPGVYRATVRLVMTSGRVLTVPTDDQVHFTINERHEVP